MKKQLQGLPWGVAVVDQSAVHLRRKGRLSDRHVYRSGAGNGAAVPQKGTRPGMVRRGAGRSRTVSA